MWFITSGHTTRLGTVRRQVWNAPGFMILYDGAGAATDHIDPAGERQRCQPDGQTRQALGRLDRHEQP